MIVVHVLLLNRISEFDCFHSFDQGFKIIVRQWVLIVFNFDLVTY